MALQKQQISLNFAGGIDTKTDPKQVLPTKLIELENAVFTRKGELKKRFGYDILSKSIDNSSDTIEKATGTATFKNELNLFTGSKLYSYLESTSSWKERGTATSAVTSSKSVVRNIYQQSDLDFSYNNGLGCYVWKDSSGGVRYSVIDEESGAFVVSNVLLNSNGQKPRTVAAGSNIFIYYIDGSAIRFRYFTVTTPTVLSAEETLTTNVDPIDKIFDAQKIGDRAYIAYNNNSVGGGISVLYMTAMRAVSSEVEILSEDCPNGVSICIDNDSNIFVSWADATAIKYKVYDYDLNVEVLVPTVVETVSNIRNIASISTTNNSATFLYEISNTVGALDANYVRKNTANTAGTVGTAEVAFRSVGLASKFFTYNSEYFITTAFQSELQSTYFVFNLNGDIVTKLSTDSGGGYTASSILPSATLTESGKFIIPTQKKGVLQAENDKLFTSLGISAYTVDFESLNNFVTSELGEQLHIVGGVLQSYDGASVNETGMAVFPETISSSLINGGNLPNGTYQYSVVYAWIDNNGQIHRSAPSIGLEVVISGGGLHNVQLVIPTLRITKKENVFIEVYRTENAGTLFYKVTSNTSLTLNDKTVDTITYVDTKTDAQILSGEILYTTGGVLENIAPPSASMITTWKNRLVIKSSDEPNVLLYSKIRNEGYPVEFSDTLRIVVDPRGGDITALGVLDDKLIIFKQNSVHMQAGDGPNNLGQQSDFGLPQLITSDAGCVDVNSVVETPDGLMFKSKKGIYMISRGASLEYVGSEVEKYNKSRVTAAKLVQDSNQVRFILEDNLCMVYDYFYKQWSTFTNHEGVGATNYQSKFTFAKANGDIYVENDTKWTDGANAVPMKVVTSWLKLADFQGFQRLYKFLLLGEYKSKHRLRVKVGYDFNSVFTQEVIVNPFVVLNPVAYGDSSPYGEEPVYGGSNPLYQWRFFPKLQKCQAVRICFEDIMDDVAGESFRISGLRLELGTKQGSIKLGRSRSAATE